MSDRQYDFKHADNEGDGFEIVKVGGRLRLYPTIVAGNYSNMNSDTVRDLRNFLTGWLQSEGYEEAPATSDTPSPVDTWPPLPKGVTGTEIRARYIAGGVRVSGAEPKVIVAETEGYVIFKVWSAKGRDLGERVLTKSDFEEQFERRPEVSEERAARVRSFTDLLNRATRMTGIGVSPGAGMFDASLDAPRPNLARITSFGYHTQTYEVEMTNNV